MANQEKTSADVTDMIFCHDCLDKKMTVVGTDNELTRRSMEVSKDRWGNAHIIYPLADWNLYEVRMARVKAARRAAAKVRRAEFVEHPIETTFTLVAGWFRRKVVPGA